MTGGSANRIRGAAAERDVCNYLRRNGWPEARRYLAGDGMQPGDIDAVMGLVIEVKDRKVPAWPLWVRQAVGEAGNNRKAVVVRRARGVRDVGEWPAVMPYADWLSLVYEGTYEGRHPIGVGIMAPDPPPRVGDIATVLVNAEQAADANGDTHHVVTIFSPLLEVSVMRFRTVIAALRAAGYEAPRA